MLLPTTNRAMSTPSAHLAPIELRDPLPPSLPAPLTSLIGREREIATVVSLLYDPTVRLLTLTGSGGVGKTRLSLQTAEATQDYFADGVAFVSLASTVDPALVASNIARALGIRETRNSSAVDRLIEELRFCQRLLILDNLEHVIDAAPLVVALLSSCPQLKVLATSRAPLRVSGEKVVEILPLTLPVDADRDAISDLAKTESVQLFVARARAVRHEFVISEENAASVAEIVRRVEGVPLAIELAAARLAHLSPAALNDRLESRLPLLTGGERDLPERQRTMRATIAWSYDLLTPDQQRLFRHLSVFVGGITLEAACAVMNRPYFSFIEVLDGVGSLIGMSLLRQDEERSDGPRYVMLEMVREYGLELLHNVGAYDVVRTRHAKWCVEFAERADPAVWGGPDHVVWLDRLETEFPNFRVALSWLDETADWASLLRLAAALGGLWRFRSYRVEGLEWLTRALDRGDAAATAARGMALIKLAVLNRGRGNLDVEDVVLEGLAIRRHLDEERALARTLLLQVKVLLEKNEDDRALEALREAEEIMKRLNEPPGLGRLRSVEAIIAMRNGNVIEAQRLYEEAVEFYERDEFAIAIAEVRLSQGWIQSGQRNFHEAAFYFLESLKHWNLYRNKEILVDVTIAAAFLGANTDRFRESGRLTGFAHALGERLGYINLPVQRERFERARLMAVETLGEEAFASEWRAGRNLSILQAIDDTRALLVAINEECREKSTEHGLVEPNSSFLGGLTPREQEVLRHVAEGKSNRQIADLLYVSERTIENHVHHILAKLDLPSRSAATGYAIRHDLA